MIDLVPYGPDAEEALLARISAVKAGDPLAAVTVIVPSNYSGLSVRRTLAARAPLVNVRFQVLARVSELLGAARLVAAGQRPLTPWIAVMAVRAALIEQPGVFEPVMRHPSTARELHRVFRELREVSGEGLERLARSSGRSADVVRLYSRFRDLTAGYFDEFDLLQSAASQLAEGSSAAVKEAGTLVFYLPRKMPRMAAALMDQAETRHGAHAVLGLTGDDEVDAVTRGLAGRLPGDVFDAAGVNVPPVQRLVSATDPEEEAREAIRQTMALVAEGTPLHRIAITYASREMYEGLLDDALTSAGLPHNGPPNRTLAQTLAGRTLLGLPRLASSAGPGDPGYARDAVMDWLTSAPIWDGNREADSHRWDEISRDARVVKGPEQWNDRLENYVLRQEAQAADRDPGERGTFERNAAWARNLQRFMRELHENAGDDRALPATEHAKAALGWLNTYLPERALLDEGQFEARAQVRQFLEGIARLGNELPAGLDAPMERSEFAAALEDALSQPVGRLGKLGEGIFIGPITLAAEMSFDAVIVLGMVEGAFPASSAEDPILTSEDRSRSGEELASPASRLTEQRRAFLGTLHAAQHRVLSTPRGDLRAQRSTQPSRWLLEAATALNAGKKVYATELGEMLTAPPAWFRVVNSFESALRNPGEPASPQEWDLGSLLRYEGRMDRHFLMRGSTGANPLARGVAARKSRSRRNPGRLDGWTGKVPGGLAPVPSAERPISPTSLETYAKCPFRYFLGAVLKVGEMERPEETVTIEPATIGNIVHQVLQDFFDATKERPDPFAEWTAQERKTLDSISSRTFEEFEKRGLTGKSLTWKAEQARIRRDLELLLERELEMRRATNYRFRQAEAAFGVPATPSRPNVLPAAAIQLTDGGMVTFRGIVDRVDAGPSGQLAVIDYKTGSMSSYEGITKANPMGGGKFLQLPVYALAFRDQSTGPVTARYWFVSERANFENIEVTLDDAAFSTFGTIVQTLVETMRAGYFPAVPGEEQWINGDTYEHCKYCPYDLVCPSNQRTEYWLADQKDPGLSAFIGLADIATQAASDE